MFEATANCLKLRRFDMITDTRDRPPPPPPPKQLNTARLYEKHNPVFPALRTRLCLLKHAVICLKAWKSGNEKLSMEAETNCLHGQKLSLLQG